MSDNNQVKKQKKLIKPNTLETIKDLGSSTAKQMRQEAAKLPENFMQELLGIRPTPKNHSGEIIPGESLEVNEVFSVKYKEVQKVRQQAQIERKMLEQERIKTEKKTNELRMYLKSVQEEILVLAQKTEDLAEDTEIAAMQAPIEPGVYHVIFFEKLLEFIKSFSKKIEEAHVWLQAVNKRASKKNAWGSNYKKSGAKYLLSGEHYVSRNAG